MQTLTLRQPDDWHVHLRDGAALARTVPDTARQFARAIIMPNLNPPVVTVEDAVAYRARIMAAVPKGVSFQPLMTLYLTPKTTPELIQQAVESGVITAIKYYPKGATTHAEHGIEALESFAPLLEALQETGLPLLLHGESIRPNCDIFDREADFIETTLPYLLHRFPNLKWVLEHISSSKAVQFVQQAPSTVAATITPHHLLLNRNDLLVGGLKPHHYCLPILKTASDQQALLEAATSGNPKFFAGTDSAPHSQGTKECALGCAGIYNACCALECYAESFEAADALDKLENFVSRFGAEFYGLPLNHGTVTLHKTSHLMPTSLSFTTERLIPLRAGQTLPWKQV